MTLLQVAYLIDAVVTAPLAVALLSRNDCWSYQLLGAKGPVEPGFRIMLGAIWSALMACATLGVLFPATMAPVLFVQLIYKTLWLVLFALPSWWQSLASAVPWKTAILFAAYVATYPWIIPWDELFSNR